VGFERGAIGRATRGRMRAGERADKGRNSAPPVNGTRSTLALFQAPASRHKKAPPERGGGAEERTMLAEGAVRIARPLDIARALWSVSSGRSSYPSPRSTRRTPWAGMASASTSSIFGRINCDFLIPARRLHKKDPAGVKGGVGGRRARRVGDLTVIHSAAFAPASIRDSAYRSPKAGPSTPSASFAAGGESR